jgi:hypothetical protein
MVDQSLVSYKDKIASSSVYTGHSTRPVLQGGSESIVALDRCSIGMQHLGLTLPRSVFVCRLAQEVSACKRSLRDMRWTIVGVMRLALSMVAKVATYSDRNQYERGCVPIQRLNLQGSCQG